MSSSILTSLKTKKTLFKFIATFCIIISIVVILLSTILGWYYKRSTINIIYDFNNKILSQTSYSATYMDDMAQSLAFSLKFDNTLNAFGSCKGDDMFTINNAIFRLQSIATYNNFIESIYLYNSEQDMVVSSKTGMIYSSDTFYDQEAIKMLKNNTSRRKQFKCIKRSHDSSNTNISDSANEVFTYLMFDSKNSNIHSTITSAIILNIDSKFLKETLSKLNDKYNEFPIEFLVLNDEGMLINYYSKESTTLDSKRLDYIKNLVTSPSNKTSYISKKTEDNFILSSVTDESLGWTFISLVPYSHIAHKVTDIILFSNLFSLLVLCVGIGFSILASKKLYTPLELLINKVKTGANFNNNNSNIDEYNMLLQALDKLDSPTSFKDSSIFSIKNEFLRNYVNQSISSTSEDLDQLMEYFKVKSIIMDNMCAFLIKVDNYSIFSQEYGEKDVALFKYAISNITAELTQTHYVNEVIDMGNDILLVIISFDDIALTQYDLETHIQCIQSICDNIQHYTSKYLNFSVSCAIHDSLFNGIALPDIYKQLLDAIKYKIVLGHGAIILASSISNIDEEFCKFPTSKEKTLLNALKLGNLDKSKEIFDDLILSISSFSSDYIYSSTIYLSFSIFNNLNTLAETKTINLVDTFKDFYAELLYLETLQDISKKFYTLFELIIHKVNETKDSKSDITTNFIIDLINQKFCDPSLCLNSIAEVLKMSSIYVGRLFKKSTGKSVAEYILDVRMAKLKTLLDTTDYPINKILDMVGLEKNNYFYTTFKKYFGMPLTTYKLELNSKKANQTIK